MTRKLEHILYVDDEASIQEVARMCLEMVGGFTVTCLNSGHQLIDQVATIRPDVILLDVMMPEMDGPSTLKKMRQEIGLKTSVIFMTARVQPAEVQEYIDMGAVGVIPKPFDPMTISEQINEIWGKLDGHEI